MAASRVGSADEAVDSGDTNPYPWGDQSYHFNRDLTGGEDTRIVHFRDHYEMAERYCAKSIDLPEKAATELGTGLHPLQDWVAHGDYGKHENPITTWHNSQSPQHNFGHPGNYPDNPELDVVGSPDGRASSGFIIDFAIIMGIRAPQIHTDFAYYERGTKRYHLTKSMTVEELKTFLWYVKTEGGCRCQRYFGVSNGN